MQLHELLGDCQSKPRAMMLPRCRSVDLRELLEDEIVMLAGDSDSGIADLDQHFLLSAGTRGRLDPHVSAGRREVDGIAEEIAEDVRHLFAVSTERRQVRRQME